VDNTSRKPFYLKQGLFCHLSREVQSKEPQGPGTAGISESVVAQQAYSAELSGRNRKACFLTHLKVTKTRPQGTAISFAISYQLFTDRHSPQKRNRSPFKLHLPS
jgi:hypothetical protein